MATIEMAGRDGGTVAVGGDALDALTGSLAGSLLAPEDAGWAEAVLIWNGMITKRPAVVAQPATTDDVRQLVRFARDRGIALSVKGGGHNIAGLSMADGGLTLDMSRLRHVEIDGDLVHVGAGCLLADVDRVTQAGGRATTIGFVSQTGVAGLTLGGGFGYLTRRFGWSVDALQSVEIVTAAGEVLTASRDEHDDLFWALRGGGGNFGVVTRFAFRHFEVGPQVTGGLIAWPADEAEKLVALYRDVTEAAPRELTVVITQRFAPPAPFVPAEWHGKPIVAMVVCHSGSAEQAAADLAPIRGYGTPVFDMIMEKPYVDQQAMLDATQPKGLHYYWKSEFMPALTDEALETYRSQAAVITALGSQLIFFHLAGALNGHDADDGAVGNRDAHYVLNVAGSWAPDAPDGEKYRNEIRTAWEAMRPHSTGGNYVNFQTADEDPSRTRAAYRDNFDRLVRVKATYDPENLFRVNRNIAPA